MALRLYLLQTHYRSPLAFREDALAAAGRGLARLRAAAEATAPADGRLPAEASGSAPPAASDAASAARERFVTLMDDDFNTPGALGVLFDLAADAGTPGEAAELFVDLLLEIRRELRTAKQWALADRIRDGLRERGVV